MSKVKTSFLMLVMVVVSACSAAPAAPTVSATDASTAAPIPETGEVSGDLVIYSGRTEPLLQPGDAVLVPNPAYPIHAYSVVIADGDLRSVPLVPGEDFFARLEEDQRIGARGDHVFMQWAAMSAPQARSAPRWRARISFVPTESVDAARRRRSST